MPIDYRILGQPLGPQVQSLGLGEAMQNAAAYQSAMQQQQMQRMQMEDYQRKREDQQAIDTALSYSIGPDGRPDRQAAARYLSLRGMGGALQNLQSEWAKGDAENRYKNAQADRELAQMGKDQAEMRKAELANQMEASKFISMVAGGTLEAFKQGKVQDAQMAWSFGLNRARQMGMNVEGISEQFDPAIATQAHAQAISAEKRLEAEFRAMEERGRDTRFKMGDETTRRGQNMVSARAGEANRVAAQGNIIKGATDIRKEFTDLPQVKNYTAAFPSYASIKEAAKGTNPQSDINLIYGVAKLYDPNSVVREGEYNTIAGSQAIPEQVKGWAQRLAGGGRLTAETKKQLLEQAEARLKTYEDEYTKALGSYKGIAQERGIEPKSVFPRAGRISPTGSRVVSRAELQELKDKAKAELGKSGAQVEADLRRAGMEIE